ncbi:MAG TPA: ferritin family protein, partial [Geobacteraceae bacterium]|nr:ferritin family protein [Geobacteraceae bacterium]
MDFDKITVQDAIRRSMLTEKNAMDFYRLGALKMRDAEARRVFELLSGEERDHAESFYRIYTGEDVPSLEAFLAHPPYHESDWMAALDKLIEAGFNEQKSLELAMQKELQLEERLSKMAENISDPAVRAVFEMNVKS